jgi:hypothetical protein
MANQAKKETAPSHPVNQIAIDRKRIFHTPLSKMEFTGSFYPSRNAQNRMLRW